MAITVNNMPSINLPFTNEQGVIHPVWYEFFRAVIANLGATSGGTVSDNTVIAGAGILGTGAVSTVNVGAGEGISVGANSIAVDILNQVNVQAAVEDEILISDASNGSAIKKTSLRDVAALSVASPGGSSTQIQYNSAGAFGGDSGFVTDGAGTLAITGQLTVDSLTFNGATISSATSTESDRMVFAVPAGGLEQFTFTQTGPGSSGCEITLDGLRSSSQIHINSDTLGTSNLANASIDFGTDDITKWAMGLYDSSTNDDFIFATASGLNSGQVYSVSGASGNAFAHLTPMYRKVTAGITASTTQTQGQGALTSDVNEVSVVTNANDTVTLPSAIAGSKVDVINNGANTLQLFPASGDNLGAGVNTSTTIAPGSVKTFIAYDSTNWEEFSPGTAYTDENAQDAVGGMVDTTLVYTDGTPLLQRAALTGDVTASAGSNATLIATPASATVATDDKVLIKDTSASDATRYVTAQSIADLASTVTTIPGGRLTLATATPVMTTDQSAKTTIYYTPYLGSTIPIYNGTTFTNTAFTELSVATTDTTKSPAAIGASKVNDWFVWNDSGTMRIGHGPDWTSDTTRSAGTALTLVNGIYLNDATITNGPAASRGTYVGTTRSNSSSQLNWVLGGDANDGSAASLYVWNMYNRVSVGKTIRDTRASHSWTTGSFQGINGATGMRVNIVTGLNEECCTVSYTHIALTSSASTPMAGGVGLDSTSTNSGSTGYTILLSGASNIVSSGSFFSGTVGLGVHYLAALEWGGTGAVQYGSSTPAQNGMAYNTRM
jgi:hypothetical protein